MRPAASDPQLQNVVNHELTRFRRKRASRPRENIDFLGMVRRIVRAAGMRVGTSDVDELKALVAIRADLEVAITEAVRGLRESGVTWQEIGDVLGVTRQAAEKYFNPRLDNT